MIPNRHICSSNPARYRHRIAARSQPHMHAISPPRLCAVLFLALTLGACAPTLKPMGPATTTPEIAGDALVAADGVRLPLRSWLPEGAPKAVILALHGFNDYSKAFEAPAACWAKRGIATYAYDQRGFGATATRGYWSGTETMTADLRAAAAAIRARHPGAKLVLLGDSMGGAVTMAALAERPVAGVSGAVLAAPAVWGRRHMTIIQKAALWFMSNLFPGVTLTGRGLGRQASDNIPMLRALGRDNLVIKETRVDAIEGLVNLMDTAFDAAPKIAAPPVLMLYGQRDEIVPENPVVEAMRALPDGRDHRKALYDTGWHMLLRDLKAERVWRDIEAWIADRNSALPSGAEGAAAKAMAAD
jgi:acylglycerol lipase